MGQRITGREVKVTLSNGIIVLFDTVTLNPSLGIGVAKTQGLPDGWTSGEKGADGEFELNTREMLKINEAASAAGSWEQLEALDITFYALVDGMEMKVEAFGCKIEAANFNFDASNSDRLKHTLPFMVTSPDFIRLNGVRLAAPPA